MRYITTVLLTILSVSGFSQGFPPSTNPLTGGSTGQILIKNSNTSYDWAWSTYFGTSSIITVGTIGTGVWNGTIISPTYGGTGINNSTRTLTLNTNSGTIDFTGASKTLTVPLDASVSGTNTGDNATNTQYSGLAASKQDANANLTTISGLTATTDNFMVATSSAWASRTPTQARSQLGGTTVGQNIFTLTNPSAVTFLRMNADNTIDARTAANLKTDLSLTIGTDVQAYDADLTTWAGITPGANVGTALATPSSANWRAAISDENGTGAALFSGMTTPDITTGFTIGGAAATGKFPIGNGTNYVPSTLLLPNAATTGDILTATATNTIGVVPAVAIGSFLISQGTGTAPVYQNTRENWTSFVVSGSNATTTGQSLVDITGLTSGTLTNAVVYEVEAWLNVTTTAVTTGTQYAIFANGSGGAAVYNALVQGTTTTNAITQVTQSSATQQGTFLTTSGTSGIIYIHGFITTRGSGTATISIQHLKVTSGTSTVLIGSKMKIRLAN